MVRDYRRRFRPPHNADLKFYRDLPSLEDAIHHAAMAIRCDGKRQPHQRRLKSRTLKAVRDQLMSRREMIRAARDFEQIFREVDDAAVAGFGQLAIYDTALRIGSWRRVMPDQVYLHAGIRLGAKALDLDVGVDSIARERLPSLLRDLEPHEAEDFLCIYKDDFVRIDRRPQNRGSFADGE